MFKNPATGVIDHFSQEKHRGETGGTRRLGPSAESSFGSCISKNSSFVFSSSSSSCFLFCSSFFFLRFSLRFSRFTARACFLLSSLDCKTTQSREQDEH